MRRAHSTAGPSSTPPLVLVEDIRFLRESITAMLRAQGLKVLAAVRSGEDALRQILSPRPRLVLIDSALTNDRGPRLVDAVTRSSPSPKVVVMDVQPAQRDIVEFVRAGATGFLLKDATATEIVSTLHDVANGACVLPPALAGELMAYVAHQRRGPDRSAAVEQRLTQRERQIIDLIGTGFSNKEIASRLNISVHTVKSHVHNVLEKLTLRSRLQVSAFARTAVRMDRVAI